MGTARGGGGDREGGGDGPAAGTPPPTRVLPPPPPFPAPLPPPGTEIGAFVVDRSIGGGGMGDVLLARDPALDRPVAVKFLRADLAGDPESVRRFSREGRTLAGISHPHVVRIYTVGSWNGRPYIVMEHLDGSDLAARLRGGPLPLEEALRVAGELASALAAVHAAGVIHRDVKPANVLLREDGTVCLIDFGLARVLARTTDTTGTTRGTPWYMAPEVIARRPCDRRVDVYSFGATLFEMLAGKVPHQDVEGAAFYRAVLEEDAPLLRTLMPVAPRSLEILLAKALARAPEFRHADGAALLDAVEGIRREIADGGCPAGPPPAEAEPPPPAPGPADPTESLPLLGRNAEYAAAVRLLADLAAWRGGLLLVEGGAGSGKSRFLREVVRAARMGALGVMQCDGSEFPGSPFRAVRAAVEGYAEGLGIHTTGAIVDRVLSASPANGPMAPALRWFLGEREGRQDAPPGRTELVQALLGLLRALVLDRPVLFVLENAHDLDAGTLDLLVAVAESGGSWPLCLALSYRPSDAAVRSPLGAVLPRLRAGARAESINLGPLNESTVARMVHLALHLDEEQSCRVASAIHRKSSGNPLYLVEILRLLRQEKWVGVEGGRYRIRERITELAIPPRMLELAARRIAGLGPREKEALAVACVDPTGVTSFLVARCLGLPRLQALQVLHELIRTRELLSQDGDRYWIPHEVIREAVWGDLIPELREAYHAEAAAELAGKGMEEEDPGRLGHHLRLSGRRAEAVPLLLEAGRRLLLLHAPAEALDRFKEAEACAGRERCPAAAVGRARALEQLGEIDAARRILDECVGAGDDAALLPMAEFLRNRGHHAEALELVRRASEHPVGAEDRIRLLVLEAQGLSQVGRLEEALGVLGRAESLAGTASPVRLLEILTTQGTVNWRMERFDEARAALDRAAPLAERLGSRDRLAIVLFNLGLVASDQGGREGEALDFLDRAIELALLVGDARVLVRARVTRAELLLAELRLEEAAAALDELEATLGKLDSADDSFLHASCRAELALAGGDVRGAAAWADRCAELAAGLPGSVVDAGALRTRVLLAAGRPVEALAEVRRVRPLAAHAGDGLLAEALIARGARALREAGLDGPEREALRALRSFTSAEAAAERALEEGEAGSRERWAAEARRLARVPRDRAQVEERLGRG